MLQFVKNNLYILFLLISTFFLLGEVFPSAAAAYQDRADRYYQRGLSLYEQGKYAEAEKEFQKAIDVAKKERERHYQKGLRLYNQAKYKEAEEEFQKAITVIQREETTSRAVRAEKTAALSAGTRKPADRRKPFKYIVGDNDVLVIKVWQNQDLDSEVIVRPDGMISFPLAGEVKAGGRTIEALRKELTEELKEFIKYPQVSVTVKSLGGKRVIVLGEVMSPGIYALTGEQTTLEAIGMAKGFTEHAVPSSVMLIQGGVENPQAKRLNLTKALDKADISDNVLMGEGDMVYVPRKFIRNANYFATQVLEPLYRAAFIAREVDDF